VAKAGHNGLNPCLLLLTALDCADRPETIKRWSNPTNTMVTTSKGQGRPSGRPWRSRRGMHRAT
jgi:hypothetical protein